MDKDTSFLGRNTAIRNLILPIFLPRVAGSPKNSSIFLIGPMALI